MDILFLITLYLVLILIITVSVIYKIIRYKSPPKDYAQSKLNLMNGHTVASSYEVKDNLLMPSSSSFIGFFNLQGGDKTANINGDMKPLIIIGGLLILEIAPVPRKISNDYKKSGNTLNTTAQIRVGAYGENGFTIEQITLPDIPLQKWFCLGILREGRRIDVIYDDKIVASRRLMNNIPTQPYGGLQLGIKDQNNQTGLAGNAQHVFLLPYRLNITDFTKFRNEYINPDGELSTKESLPIPFYNVSVPSINFDTSSVSSPPANTLQKWYTPYN